MTPEQIDRVFGRGRLKMVTGEHVEVFREAVAPGERRRYTKRFLNTREGDFGQWTEREWRILARLIGHGITCVPDVVQFDRGRVGGMRIVQTYDAGVTVDQWATTLPVLRDGLVYRHVFEDCAHWWALAHHCLLALNEIHRLELVHLDIKGDNVCIPYAPASFDPESDEPALRPVFAQFALIDFAFALVSKESLTTPLPIGWQKEYDYQSPRLLAALEAGRNGDLQATRELDWRCDMYSLAAMLKRYLPDADVRAQHGWTGERYDAAKALILRIRDAHDAELPARRPHAELMDTTGARLREPELASSLERGWELARGLAASAGAASPLTPVTRVAPITRIAAPISVARSGRVTAVTVVASAAPPPLAPVATTTISAKTPPRSARAPALVALLSVVALAAIAASVWYAGVSNSDPEAALSSVRPLTEGSGDSTVRVAAQDQPAPAVASKSPGVVANAENHAGPLSSPSPTTIPAQSRAALPPREPRDSAGASPRASVAPTPAAPTPAAATPAPPIAVHPLPPIAAPASPAASLQQRSAGYAPATATRSQSKSSQPRANARTPATAVAAAPATPKPSFTREYASWASLQPPAWVRSRNHSPGQPPGYKAPESDATITTVATETAPVTAAPVDASKPGLQSLPLASVDPPREVSGATPAPAASAAGDARRAASRSASAQMLFASRSAAPVEDRSENLALAAPSAEPRSRAPAETARPDDVAAQAQRLLADTVPRGEAEVSRVLLIAASAYRPAQDQTLAAVARTTRIRDDALLPSVRSSAEARRLHNQARAVFASGRNVREALDLQLRAFSANPRDPEIAGYLAVLYLKTTPPQPDLARQVSLMALTARSSQYATTRLEDWQTFAVASALSGRDTDARNALFVTLALSNNVERSCVAGWNALANYGDRMRGPVEAMLYRVYMRGHSVDSPWCAYPPDFSAPPRLAGELVHH